MLGSSDVFSVDEIDGYKVLPMHSLFKTKLSSFTSRGDDKDYDDLVWMYDNRADSTRDFTRDMKQEHREEFLYEYAERENDDEKTKTLAGFLGLEWKAGRRAGSVSSVMSK